jgi:hypothetical protein
VLQLLAGPGNRSLEERIFGDASWIITGMALLYALCLYLLFPAYLIHVAPLVVISYPYVYLPLSVKIAKGIAIIAAAIFLVFECVREPRRQIVWYGFLGAATLVYCLNAGWSYTLYLLLAPITLLCCMLLIKGQQEESHRFSASAIKKTALCLIALLTALSVWSLAKDIRYTSRDGFGWSYSHLPPAFYRQLRTAAGGDFIMLSTTLWGMNIDQLAGQPHSVFAYDSLWPLPWLYAHPHDLQAEYVQKAMADPLLAALRDYPSAPVIVDTSPMQWLLPDGFDLLGFFKEDGRLSSALSSYRQAETLDDCADAREPDLQRSMCRFTVWRRIAATPR